jgi:hypothetical protein
MTYHAQPWPYKAEEARRSAIELADNGNQTLEAARRLIETDPKEARHLIADAQIDLVSIARFLEAAKR